MPSPWRRVAPFVALLALAALVTLAGWLGYRYTYDTALARQAERGQVQLRLYAQALESELARYDYVPSLLSLDARIEGLLREPGDPAHVAQANAYLASLNIRAGTRVVYVLDARGKVLATSNYQRPDSYLGEDLSFRPYFRTAIDGQLGRFYGVGTTRSESGYYLSAPLGDRDRPQGVAVVKIGLEPLENRWQGNDSQMLLADENGVVILASDPSWKLAALRPLSADQRAKLDRSLQYNRAPLAQLELSKVRALGTGPAEGGDALMRLRQGPPMLAQHLALAGTDWNLTLLTNTSQARVAALNSAALEAANSELERKVAERTADLSATNQQLHAEVAERIRTETVLRQAQDGLMQAGKLAAVGQMSAGIAHELNQPLTALRTLSGNTGKFLERGDYATVQHNLDKIVGLVERMGRITGALKSFARNPSASQRSVAYLGDAVENALFLLETRVAAVAPRIERQIDARLAVACDPNRLEQVLVNLIGNALDALRDRPDPLLSLHAYETGENGGMVHLTVRDNGPGLSEAAFAKLFEPFFTTKPAGEGLGLGLTLSAGILNENGGTLTAINHPDGGACFTLALPQARETLRHVG
ncbi:sensor histidine kinase [Cupriavidus metallidurans]|uniref:C4-dicarboxylate transport sensor protein DctB n=2 Tax=Cupriavidus metallidurans TaxID=119219 RepID=Q1LQV1_CUPMC|nr:ATP-binding protein [Cupriavidus metallidurans]ABF07475.1 signal transduction histidine kinase regulating C4-dicarboxylate transport system [Cupriavidus metallidurans CH34]QGS30857.1 sensor histidine kinase [Cupriavidus metallidurans]